jgi:hypothetical protein
MSPQRRPPDATDEFLTVAEVAEVAETLKLNQQTIREQITDLPGHRGSEFAFDQAAAQQRDELAGE